MCMFFLCVERAVFCVSAPYIVFCGCFLYVILPAFRPKCGIASFAPSGCVSFVFSSAVVHLVVCSIFLFVFLLRVHVLMQCVRRFWFFGIYLLRSRSFDTPRFLMRCYIVFCCCMYISIFGMPVPLHVLLPIISVFLLFVYGLGSSPKCYILCFRSSFVLLKCSSRPPVSHLCLFRRPIQ